MFQPTLHTQCKHVLIVSVCPFLPSFSCHTPQVQDDVGQAVVLGALEAAGLVGKGTGQVPPHHVLFCSTLDGKVSIVRQIEPDLHIDGSGKTIEDLKRFMPQLLHVTQPGTAAAGAGSTNIRSSPSLAAYFQL